MFDPWKMIWPAGPGIVPIWRDMEIDGLNGSRAEPSEKEEVSEAKHGNEMALPFNPPMKQRLEELAAKERKDRKELKGMKKRRQAAGFRHRRVLPGGRAVTRGSRRRKLCVLRVLLRPKKSGWPRCAVGAGRSSRKGT